MSRIVIIMCFFIISCNNNDMFIDLKNHSGSGVFSRGDDEGKSFYYESTLVDNLPSDTTSMKSKLLAHHSKKIDSVFKNKEIIQFSSTFYDSNTKTAYFIDNSDDPGGFSSEILLDYYDEYGIAEIVTRRINDTDKLKTEISFVNNEKSDLK